MTRKLRRTGRHATPWQLDKAARRAGMAVPALAVLGALVAASPVLTTANSAAAGRAVSAEANSGSQLAGAGSSRVLADAGTYRPQRVLPARVARVHATARHHHAASHGLTCSGSGGMLPANYAAIVGFLTAHGYTGLAAAGIAGNIYQESGGNPESEGTGGGGLIGWTPLPAGFVTGNPAADLHTQLEALLAFNQQWSGYIPALNAATSAAGAADIYMNDFERPGFPAAGNREAAASAVASACGL